MCLPSYLIIVRGSLNVSNRFKLLNNKSGYADKGRMFGNVSQGTHKAGSKTNSRNDVFTVRRVLDPLTRETIKSFV